MSGMALGRAGLQFFLMDGQQAQQAQHGQQGAQQAPSGSSSSPQARPLIYRLSADEPQSVSRRGPPLGRHSACTASPAPCPLAQLSACCGRAQPWPRPPAPLDTPLPAHPFPPVGAALYVGAGCL